MNQYVNAYGDVISYALAGPPEPTIEDFGWLCDQGHGDCADIEDGPCTHDPEAERQAAKAHLERIFGNA